MARDYALANVVERITRQEQAIKRLVASGRDIVRAEKRLTKLRRDLDAMLSRRAKAGKQGNMPAPIPDQLGPEEQQGQPGAEAL